MIIEIVIKFKNNFVEKISPIKKSKLLIKKKSIMEKIRENRKGCNFINCARKSKGIVLIRGYNCGRILKNKTSRLTIKKVPYTMERVFSLPNSNIN